MLVALVFVLARNIVKLVVERRRGLPFARFRAKLVALLLGMTLRADDPRADGRQRADSDEHRSLVQRADGRDPRRRRSRSPATTTRSGRCWSATTPRAWRARLADVDLTNPDVAPDSRSAGARRDHCQRVQLVEVYRVAPAVGALPGVEPVVDVAAPALPPGYNARRPIAWRRRRSAARPTRRRSRRCCSGGRSAARGGGHPRPGRPADRRRRRHRLPDRRAWPTASRRMTQAFESYNQLRVLQAAADRRLPVVLPDGHAAHSVRRDLDGLVPGEADHRVPCRCWRRRRAKSARASSISGSSPRATTSSARSIEAFNAMAGELRPRAVEGGTVDRSSSSASTSRSRDAAATSRRFSNASRPASCRSTPRASITTINSAAARLLGLDRHVVGQPAAAVFERARPPAAAGDGRWRPARAKSPSRRRRRSRCRATSRSSTSRPWRRRSSATAARTRASCSCWTT